MTIKEVKRIVDQEGLGNATENIIQYSDIEDVELRGMWMTIQIYLDRIKEILKKGELE